jgi:hypothetical protein
MATLREQYESMTTVELERLLSDTAIDLDAQNTLKSVLNAKRDRNNIEVEADRSVASTPGMKPSETASGIGGFLKWVGVTILFLVLFFFGRYVFGIAGMILIGELLFDEELGLFVGTLIALLLAVYVSFDLIGSRVTVNAKYKVLRGTTGKYVAVKQGFSWPAFFFDFLWLLHKRLWAFSAFGFLIWVALVVKGIDSYPGEFEVIALFFFVWKIVLGINGNSWHESDLILARKYALLGPSDASNRGAAISQYSDREVSSDSLDLDSSAFRS